MKNRILTLVSLLFISFTSNAQTFFTKTGTIIFKSKSVVEKIESHNKAVACILNTQTGEVQVALNIKSFVFDKQLMQEHFNENYMESDKFPKSTFVGKMDNLGAVNFAKDGKYQTKVSGKLSIHGVTKNVILPVSLIVKGENIQVQSDFSVAVADYNIEIPGVVRDKISKNIEIELQANLNKK